MNLYFSLKIPVKLSVYLNSSNINITTSTKHFGLPKFVNYGATVVGHLSCLWTNVVRPDGRQTAPERGFCDKLLAGMAR